MTLEVVYGLVLLAAVAHAAWNALVKASGDRLLLLAAIRAVGLFGGIGVALFAPVPASSSLPFLAGAAAIHYVYYAFLLGAYRVGDLSQVYPIARGLAPLVVVVLAVLFADERLNAISSAAVVMISFGIISLARPTADRTDARAVLFAIGTGLAIAGYTFVSGLGVRRSGTVLGYAAWLEIATGAGMLAAAWVLRRDRIAGFVRAQWRTGLAVGILSVGGYLIALWAMTRAAMAPVAALRETSVVFAALIGTFVLHERFGLQRLAAALAVVAGIAALGFA